MSKKIFVLDTNVLLAEPGVIFSFDEHDIVVPLIVIEELDKFKKDNTKLGFVAREFSRDIDKFRETGNLIDGVSLGENRGTLKIVTYPDIELTQFGLDLSVNDNNIIATAGKVGTTTSNEVILVSKDMNVRIKADVLGIPSETYLTGSVDYYKLPKGLLEMGVDSDFIDKIYKDPSVPVDREEIKQLFPDITPNTYLLLKSESGENKQVIVRYKDDNTETVFIKIKNYKNKSKVYGLKSKNIEQTVALDMLLSPDIKLVNLIGKSGTGKTLLSIAVGLQEVTENGNYNKLVVARPIFPMGNDIGYLPGDVGEKLRPWIQPIIDNMEYLFQTGRKTPTTGETSFRDVNELLDSEYVHVEALTYIRGRSIPNQYLIIDESQNLSIHEIKTIISRVGEGTKIVLTGDPNQIDSPYLSKENNGLVYSMDKMKDSSITAHIILEKGERSELADLAVEKL